VPAYICRTCGVQHASSAQPPPHCPICEDERQYVPPQGQRWATLQELQAEGRRAEIRELEPGLTGIGADPSIGIGQRALLVQTAAGNILWDCLGFIDDAGVAAVRDRGGLSGIAMSHPHFYGVCVEWSQAFSNAPIFIPEADRRWVMRPDPAVRMWRGTFAPVAGLTPTGLQATADRYMYVPDVVAAIVIGVAIARLATIRRVGIAVAVAATAGMAASCGASSMSRSSLRHSAGDARLGAGAARAAFFLTTLASPHSASTSSTGSRALSASSLTICARNAVF